MLAHHIKVDLFLIARVADFDFQLSTDATSAACLALPSNEIANSNKSAKSRPSDQIFDSVLACGVHPISRGLGDSLNLCSLPR